MARRCNHFRFFTFFTERSETCITVKQNCRPSSSAFHECDIVFLSHQSMLPPTGHFPASLSLGHTLQLIMAIQYTLMITILPFCDFPLWLSPLQYKSCNCRTYHSRFNSSAYIQGTLAILKKVNMVAFFFKSRSIRAKRSAFLIESDLL